MKHKDDDNKYNKYKKNKVKYYDDYFVYLDNEPMCINDLVKSIHELGIRRTERQLSMSAYIVNKILKHYNINSADIIVNGLPIVYDGDIAKIRGKEYSFSEMYDYYMTQNNSLEDSAAHFCVTKSLFSNIMYHYGVKKPRQLTLKHNRITCLKKYGDANYNNIEKHKQTCLERYGVDNVRKSEEVKQKIRDTHINNFGSIENYYEHVVNKTRQTCREKYGVDSYLSTEECREKIRSTLLEHYGVTSPMKSDEIKNKYDFFDIAKKSFATKLRNGTTNTSKPENNLYEILVNKFGKDDVIRQYCDDNRYPFHCDFYIKSIDLFIELNLYFTHGKHPFGTVKDEDDKQLSIWKDRAKKSKFYENAINVWTNLDVNKQKYARQNHLNYIMIYNMKEYDEFIYSLGGYNDEDKS